MGRMDSNTDLALTSASHEESRADAEVLNQKVAESLFDDHWPKGSLKTTEISMGGVKVKVRTDSTPALLKQIREAVDHKFEEFSDKLARGVSTHQLAVLVAFNLAEELLKERERNRLLKRRTVESLGRLMNRVESHLDKEKTTR